MLWLIERADVPNGAWLSLLLCAASHVVQTFWPKNLALRLGLLILTVAVLLGFLVLCLLTHTWFF